MHTLRKLSCLGALALGLVEIAYSESAFGQTPTQEIRVLLMVVDGNQPVPRSLRHYEDGRVTNTSWTDASTIHHFAFERDSSFARLFEEMSYGQLSLSGDTLLMAFPFDASAHTWQQWTAFADAEAQSRGFDLSAYDRFLYILPFRPSNVPGSGLASGSQGLCAHLSYVELGCLFHELGHTIDFRHTAELGPDGTTTGNRDVSDGLMGSAFNAHVNAVNKHLVGWLTGSRLKTVDAPGSGAFTLAAQSTSADVPQVIRVVDPGARPGIGVVDTFVSYRDTGGFDGQLVQSLPDANGAAVADSVLVHQGSRSGSNDTLYLRALKAGESYDENGVTVTVDGIAGGDATVTVTRAVYDPTPPVIAISPENFNAHPWKVRYYTVSVTNTNDPAVVAWESFYDLAFTPIGAGWVTGWGALIESVAPGETRDFQLLVAAPTTAALGTYDFTITATDAGGDAGPVSAQASASFTLVGSGVDTDPPTAPTGLTGSEGGVSVWLTWSPSSDADSGVGGYEVLREDDTEVGSFAPIGTTVVTSYTDATVAAGRTYRYAVRAFDTAGNLGIAGAPFSVTVTDTLPPDAPTGLEAAALPERVDLFWNPAGDNVAVVGYEVLRNGAVIASISGTAFSDTTVASGVTYDYAIRAFDAGGNTGPASPLVIVEIPAPAPEPVEPVPAPVNLRVNRIDLDKAKVQIAWEEAAGGLVTVTQFQVFRDGALLATTDGQKVDDKTLVLNTTYVYSVRAVAGDGRVSADSSPVTVVFGEADGAPGDSAPDTAAPSAPADLTVSYEDGKHRNKLRWKSSTDDVGVVAYDVIRDGIALARVEASDKPRYNDESIVSGSAYTYAVVALDAAGNRSPESNAVAISIP